MAQQQDELAVQYNKEQPAVLPKCTNQKTEVDWWKGGVIAISISIGTSLENNAVNYYHDYVHSMDPCDQLVTVVIVNNRKWQILWMVDGRFTDSCCFSLTLPLPSVGTTSALLFCSCHDTCDVCEWVEDHFLPVNAESMQHYSWFMSSWWHHLLFHMQPTVIVTITMATMAMEMFTSCLLMSLVHNILPLTKRGRKASLFTF